jgi:outer membrane lipoprotein-sorting protein
MRKAGPGSTLLLVLLTLCGCSWFNPPNDRLTMDFSNQLRPDEALFLLLARDRTDAAPRTFKGVGTIKWRYRGQPQTARAALAGAVPNKLRIEILAATGQPVISLATDGDSLYLLSHSDQRYMATKPGRLPLSRLVTVPVKVDEITALLCGRPPPFQYQKASISTDGDGQGYILTLKQKWGAGLQKLYMTHPDGHIRWLEMYAEKKMIYRADFKKMQTVQGFRVPDQLTLTDANGTQLWLEIDRYWPDASLTPDLFVLKPPDHWEQLPAELSTLLPVEP